MQLLDMSEVKGHKASGESPALGLISSVSGRGPQAISMCSSQLVEMQLPDLEALLHRYLEPRTLSFE